MLPCAPTPLEAQRFKARPARRRFVLILLHGEFKNISIMLQRPLVPLQSSDLHQGPHILHIYLTIFNVLPSIEMISAHLFLYHVKHHFTPI